MVQKSSLKQTGISANEQLTKSTELRGCYHHLQLYHANKPDDNRAKLMKILIVVLSLLGDWNLRSINKAKIELKQSHL